jgi:hypothetical protein
MANETANVLNTFRGKTAVIPRWILEHPKFNACLTEVDAAQKPYATELYTSQTPDEFEEKKSKRGRKNVETPEEAPSAGEPESDED